MDKPKLIYVLPKYQRDISTHVFFLYNFIEQLSRRYDIWLITLSGDDPREGIKGPVHHTYLGKYPKWLKICYFSGAVKLARLRGFKMVYVHYSYWAAIIASLVTRFTGGRVWYWNCGMHWLFGSQPVLQLVLRLVHKQVTGTRRVAGLYAKHMGIPYYKIEVMPNWIDLERFADLPSKIGAREKLGLDLHAPTILFDHKLVWRKGADMLPEILEALPDDTHLVVVGGGELEERLVEEFKVRGLSSRVFMKGWVPATDIPLYMRAADLYVMPSREEGFPRTILEAMAVGTPYVSSDVGGMCDITPEDLIDSLLVSEQNMPAGIIDRTNELLADSQERDRIGIQLRSEVEQYETTNVVERFVEIVR